ncbi:phospholipase D family protein [Rhizobium leguminosarum]|uniref:phospholipase D family protein n=1 Tax=Rhizobium leguminosarum TaxID=384 RepID=UPI003F9C6CA9
MTAFLDEAAALKSVREMLLDSDEATLVVAFWGAGAIKSLGLQKSWKSLRIVCNLDSGACNPCEVEELMSLQNAEVRTDWRLHGKVYLTPETLIMGSSNASSNGLVVEGAAISGWAEANIKSRDPELIKQLFDWCNTRFSQAVGIDPEKLDLARVAWKARKAFAPVNGGLTSNLVDLVRRQPDHPAFDKLKVVQWARPTSAHAAKVFDEAVQTDGSLKGTDIYEGWGADMEVGDWLIDFNVSKKIPEFTAYWRVVHWDEENDVTFVREADSIDMPTLGKLSVAKVDLPRLAEAMARSRVIERGPKEKIAGISDVVQAMENAAAPVNGKAFDRAMFSIYDKAAALGYKPTEFRSMVERLGGVGAARQLLGKPGVSEGFTRLWELQRLDLTVEALVLKSEWRHLFTSEELNRARKRLVDMEYVFPE